MPVRVLFVCLGNICRSPMAEGVLRHLVDEAGLSDRIEVDSAGTSSWHIGESAHRGTRNVLRQHGIAYDGRARQITPRDFDQFDYILAMDDSNLADLRAMLPNGSQAVVRRFLDFADGITTREVPDPYYTRDFEGCLDIIEAGSRALLDRVQRVQ